LSTSLKASKDGLIMKEKFPIPKKLILRVHGLDSVVPSPSSSKVDNKGLGMMDKGPCYLSPLYGAHNTKVSRRSDLL